MEKAKATLMASLDVDCPRCDETFDAMDQDDGGHILKPIFNNAWVELAGCEVTCPHCEAEIELTEIEW